MSDSSLLRDRRSSSHGPKRKRSARGFLRALKPRVQERMRFLGGFLRGPAKVGALAPSSRFLARTILRGFPLESSETVIELGPGTGALTGPILDAIGKRTTFIALELDPIFARELKNRYPSVKVYNASAERIGEYLTLNGKKRADYIISGLPWASIPMPVQDRIFESILGSLEPGGVFTTFGYLHARVLPNALKFRGRLEKAFSRVETSEVVWWNIPPAFVYRCVR